MMTEQATGGLDLGTADDRLDALRRLMELHEPGAPASPSPVENVNNHIHTIYSFSPYSPAKAAYMAWQSGLATAGIMDHDSVGGSEEFIRAGEIIGIATTVGFECRCSAAKTPFEGKRLNNPDQKSVAYLAMHGIPRRSVARAQALLAPLREKRNLRNRAMTERLGAFLAPCGIALDFDKDIAAISQCGYGGSVTERHILFALSNRIISAVGKGDATVDFLENKLGVPVSGGNLGRLKNPDEPMYEYYLLGVLKSHLVERFYIDATDECPHITEFVEWAAELGAIPAYAYLGDVSGSVTGDKKDQTFEDSYLDELIAWLAGIGFRALTYMPTRNTPEQLGRVMDLCKKHGLFQISGEDINSPFQPFVCAALARPEFNHLADSAWALIGHEKAAEKDIENGMFSAKTIARMPRLEDRTAYFSAVGRGKIAAE